MGLVTLRLASVGLAAAAVQSRQVEGGGCHALWGYGLGHVAARQLATAAARACHCLPRLLHVHAALDALLTHSLAREAVGFIE